MSFHVIHPGTFSLLVDGGRPRTRSLGVPLGGPADRAAFRLANRLIGNPADATALEITLSGPTLLADNSHGCCLFGAPFSLEIDGRPISPAHGFTIRPGQTLRIGATASGSRGYLAVTGGFHADRVLGSCSALAPLTIRSVLACGSGSAPGRSLETADAASALELPLPDGRIRVLPGPQADWFPANELADAVFRVSPSSNRMGVRLEGFSFNRPDREMVSEPVAPGAIQVTNEGRPIILGVDGQTIGGYPKIAHVISADLDTIGQLRPGQRLRFSPVTLEQARVLLQERQRRLGCLERLLALGS